MVNFWTKLPRPILVLAPMADVTDAAFRAIIAKYSRPAGPAVFYTEFVSADGLVHPTAGTKLRRELYFTPAERPIVAQIFSAHPDRIYEAAGLIAKLGFDGLDINMGCPDRSVEKQGAGAALIKQPKLAQEIIRAAQAGAPALPVSVKTRLGYASVKEWPAWAAALLEVKPAALAVHLRTRKELSKVSAHWQLAPTLVQAVAGSGVPILANGDVVDLSDAKTKASKYNLDGIMLGRAIFGRPWLFADTDPRSVKIRLQALIEHIELFAELYLTGPTNDRLFGGHRKNWAVMKKHFKAYVSDWPEAGRLRETLMTTTEPQAAVVAIKKELARHRSVNL